MPRWPALPRAVTSRLAGVAGDEQTILLVWAAGIGTASGLAVTIFYRFIDLVQQLALRGPVKLSAIPAYIVIPLVVLAGLAAARALVQWGAKGSEGENVPDVMYRVSVKGGQIPFLPVLYKTAAAGILIGTGGSVGQEGPVIVAGAATASRLGRWLRASPHRLRTLVGCGAAAGLSAAFNAPIAGLIFGIEKILGTTGDVALGPFVVASILATAVSRSVFGNRPVLAMPAAYTSGTAQELILYVLLGLITGAASVLYSRGVWRVHDWLRKMPGWQRVVVAAAVVGTLDVVFRADLWGHGAESLNLSIVNEKTVWFLLGLTAAKLIATALTLGAAGTGGVFTPALFIGATLGGAFAGVVHLISPTSTLAPAAAALVGMAGLVAGSTHAPLTAIFMVFEMTGDYALILPLMLTGVLAFLVARRLAPESIYTEWLARRGVHLSHGADAAILARVPIAECMDRAPDVVPESAGIEEIKLRLSQARLPALPVIDADGRLRGMLSPASVRDATQADPALAGVVIALDLAETRYEPLTTDNSLLSALRLFARYDVPGLPVVAAGDADRLVGTVSRASVWAVYDRHLSASHH